MMCALLLLFVFITQEHARACPRLSNGNGKAVPIPPFFFDRFMRLLPFTPFLFVLLCLSLVHGTFTSIHLPFCLVFYLFVLLFLLSPA